MRPPRDADQVVTPWDALDWSNNGPYGAATSLRDPRPCVICKRPAYLLSPEKSMPTHKVCAEEYTLVGYLTGVLAALGRTEITRDALQ